VLTDEQIRVAIEKVKRPESNHEHPDCVRIAYAWLDAQANTKHAQQSMRPLKHIIERWGGRYVSQTDVEAAALLHPRIKGSYPSYNISSRLIEPSDARLAPIGQAFAHDYRDRHSLKDYARREES